MSMARERVPRAGTLQSCARPGRGSALPMLCTVRAVLYRRLVERVSEDQVVVDYANDIDTEM